MSTAAKESPTTSPTTSPAPSSTSFTVEMDGNSRAVAKVGSRVVGMAYAWNDSRDKFVIMNAEVRPNYRRRGIASAMYKAIEKNAGRELAPAVSLSDDAFNLWKSFRPQAVALDLRHWKDQLIGAVVMKNGLPGKIIKADGGTAMMEYTEPQPNGTQSVILRKDLNSALAAGGSRTIDFDDNFKNIENIKNQDGPYRSSKSARSTGRSP